MLLKIYISSLILRSIIPMESSSLHFKSRLQYKQTAPCALSFGRLLRRSPWIHPCKSSRKMALSLYDLPSRERGPPRIKSQYDPTFGFEKYWEFGDWVFDPIKARENETKMCGQRCPELYTKIGPICAVDKEMDTRTFKDYCELKNNDCEDNGLWSMVYRGPCLNVSIYSATDPNELVDRANKYLNEFYKNSPTTTPTTTRSFKIRHQLSSP